MLALSNRGWGMRSLYGRRFHIGFTLLEVTVVILVMAIVGWTVAAHISYSQVDQKAQAGVVKSHLRYAQARAMNTDTYWGLKFDRTRYWMFQVDPAAGGAEQADAPVGLPGADAAVVNLSPPLAATTLVAFDGWGRPFSDALCQTPRGSAPLDLGAGTDPIVITPNTGFIP